MKRIAVVLLIVIPLRADTLADVKAAIARLTARQPVRATFTIHSLSKASGRFANNNSSRNVAVEVAHDAEGVTIVVPQALVEKASDEQAARAIASISPLTVARALDAR